MDIGLHHFIYDRLNFKNILKDKQDLGAHTDIAIFQPGRITTFAWIHPGIRPMGFDISKQCPECQYLKTLHPTISQGHLTTTLKCENCKKIFVYTFPTGWKWAHGPPVKGDQRGSWIISTD